MEMDFDEPSTTTTTTTPWEEEGEEVEEVTVKIEQDDWEYDAFEMNKHLYNHHSNALNKTLATSTSGRVKKRKYKKRRKLYFYKPKTRTKLPSTPTPPRIRDLSVKRAKKVLTVQEVLNQSHNPHSQDRKRMNNKNPHTDLTHDDSNLHPQLHHDDGFTPRLRQRKLKPRKGHVLQDPPDPVKKRHPIAIEMNVVEKMDIDSIPGPPFNCSIPKCRDAFGTREDLRVHVHEKHVASQCPLCQGQFRNMRQHIYSWHKGHYPQYKHMFSKRPTRSGTIDEEQFEKLDLHSLFKLGPPFKCPISDCIPNFKSVKALRGHIWEKHVLKSCPVCKRLVIKFKQHVIRLHPEVGRLFPTTPSPQPQLLEGACPIMIKEEEQAERDVKVFKIDIQPRIIQVDGSFFTSLNLHIDELDDNHTS